MATDSSPGQGSVATAAPGMGRQEVGPSPRSRSQLAKPAPNGGERGRGVGWSDELVLCVEQPDVRVKACPPGAAGEGCPLVQNLRTANLD